MTFPEAALSQHIAVLGKTGAGKSSVMRGIVEGLLEQSKPACIIDPKGDWWGLKSSADGKHAGFPVMIFGGEHADIPINAHSGAAIAELVATGNRPCIIDLGGWMVGERTRFFIDFASSLFRHSKGPRYLVIDEVHNFAPQGKVLDPNAGKMLHWANRLASEGRGKGITMMVASQRPQKVHKDLLTSCETLVAMRVIHPLDRGAIKDWIDGCPDPVKGKEVLGSLASMPRGTGWVWSPEINFGPEKINFPMFRTYDSFKPQAHDQQKLKGWAEVDLEGVKVALADAVREAEENDPKALRARIAELEREARAKPVAPLDPDQVASARRDGYLLALRSIQPIADRLTTMGAGMAETIDGLQDDLRRIGAMPMPPAPRGGLQLPRIQKETSYGSSPMPAATSGAAMAKAERLVLTALAQYPQGRTKAQIAVLTGYAVNGGGFNNALGALRSKGYAEGSGDALRATPAGIEALGPFERLPVGSGLLDHWLARLGKAERSVLAVAVEAYPKALSKEETARRAQYEPNGGGFNNALGRLRSLELITGRGEIRASENLFGY